MDFEWDSRKAAANLSKHGIDFGDAIAIFDDPMVGIEPDPRNYGGEMRYRAIGRVGDTILFVCFTMRELGCRIISARRASRRERKVYSLQAWNRSQAGRPN
jgi:uncharacterized protein